MNEAFYSDATLNRAKVVMRAPTTPYLYMQPLPFVSHIPVIHHPQVYMWQPSTCSTLIIYLVHELNGVTIIV